MRMRSLAPWTFVVLVPLLSNTESALVMAQQSTSQQRHLQQVLPAGSGKEEEKTQGQHRLQHDACETNRHCLNGGQCRAPDRDEPYFKHCHCPEGFGGQRCESHCPLRCQHGGYCHPIATEQQEKDASVPSPSNHGDENTAAHTTTITGGSIRQHQQQVAVSTDPADYACRCLGWYTGRLCHIPYENCADQSRCLNGGKCMDNMVRYGSWDSVGSSPKPNSNDTTAGTIASKKRSFCKCPAGYTGKICESAPSLSVEDPIVGASTTMNSSISSSGGGGSNSSSQGPGGKSGRVLLGAFLATAVTMSIVAVYFIFVRWHRYRRVPVREHDTDNESGHFSLPECEPRWKNVV